jgi:hypothetical protein
VTWRFEQSDNLPDVSRLDLDGEWANVRIGNDRRPGFARVNRGLDTVARHPAYNYEVRLTISYENVGANGLPTLGEEMTAVDAIEDDVRAALEAERRSLLAVAVTRDGVRELTFYTRDPSGVAAWFEGQKRSPLTHRLEILIRPDPEWQAFHTYSDPR